jgi:hypothetical protein
VDEREGWKEVLHDRQRTARVVASRA